MRKVRQTVSLREWEERIYARQSSGQTVAVWCKENGFSEYSYYYWLRKLREEALKKEECPSATPVLPAFCEVKEASDLLVEDDPRIKTVLKQDSSPLVSLQLPSLILEVDGAVNQQEVKVALAVLKSLCF